MTIMSEHSKSDKKLMDNIRNGLIRSFLLGCSLGFIFSLIIAFLLLGVIK